jgi:hypothetical protein
LSPDERDIEPFLKLFEERLKSFEKTVMKYPRRMASIPSIHVPTIEAASNELDDVRKKLKDLIGVMSGRQAKKFAKLEGKHDSVKLEYLTRKPVNASGDPNSMEGLLQEFGTRLGNFEGAIKRYPPNANSIPEPERDAIESMFTGLGFMRQRIAEYPGADMTEQQARKFAELCGLHDDLRAEYKRRQ